jgi:UDP-N-acetylglucosamine acyltransferase
LGWLQFNLPGKNAIPTYTLKRTSMPVHPSAQVHSTAVISPEANLGPNVQVGPFSVVEGPVEIGADCVLNPHVHLIGPLKMGQGNRVGTGTVIGSDPQHLGYRGQPARTEVGDFNVFREHVTVHRGSHVEGHGVTRIGNHNYLMAASHVGHDSKVGDHCILANCALLGGHCEVHDRVFLSGNTSLHQFVRVGRHSLLTGNEGCGKDIIPFVIVANRKHIVGINSVGLRRAGISSADIGTVREAFRILYRSGLLARPAVDRLEAELGGHPLVDEMIQFVRGSRRGVIPTAGQANQDEED